MKLKHYYDILHNPMLEFQPENTVNQIMFKSIKHNIYTVNQQKVALSLYDDKRFMVDLINQRALGHWRNPEA